MLTILSVLQCGFWPKRSTMNIDLYRATNKKLYEQKQGLFQAFVDLTKTFDTKVKHLPRNFLDIIQSLHDHTVVGF